MRKDVDEPETTKQWLVGTESDTGFLQLSGMKKTILDFMFRAVHSAADHSEMQQSSDAIIKDVLPKLSSPMVMYATFLKGRPDRPSASKDDDVHPPEDEGDRDRQDAFETWIGSLASKGAQAAARLFYDICVWGA